MQYSGWFEDFIRKVALQQEALEKLPPEDASGAVADEEPEQETTAPPEGAAAGAPPTSDPNAAPPADPNAMGTLPAQPMDPMGMPGGTVTPAPEPKPLVFNNKFMVQTPEGMGFVVEFEPKLVNDDGASNTGAPDNQMADKTNNPNADPQALSNWMGQDKSLAHNEQGTVDPGTQQQEGIPVHDIGASASKKKLDLLRLAYPGKMPGADMSNPYMPCAACANYVASSNECIQGLDVEKVQAAGSCSWLNSNFRPVKDKESQFGNDPSRDDESFKTDVSQLPGGNTGVNGVNGMNK